MSADQELAERLAFVVGSLNRRLRQGEEGLTHVAVSALASIARAGAIRPSALARVEGIGAPGTTRIVADLEQRGLVEREADPADGRSHLLRLTEEGEQAVAAARRARAEGVARLLEAVDPVDRAVLERAVGVLERAMLRVVPEAAARQPA